jgi:hypothetical protein
MKITNMLTRLSLFFCIAATLSHPRLVGGFFDDSSSDESGYESDESISTAQTVTPPLSPERAIPSNAPLSPNNKEPKQLSPLRTPSRYTKARTITPRSLGKKHIKPLTITFVNDSGDEENDEENDEFFRRYANGLSTKAILSVMLDDNTSQAEIDLACKQIKKDISDVTPRVQAHFLNRLHNKIQAHNEIDAQELHSPTEKRRRLTPLLQTIHTLRKHVIPQSPECPITPTPGVPLIPVDHLLSPDGKSGYHIYNPALQEAKPVFGTTTDQVFVGTWRGKCSSFFNGTTESTITEMAQDVFHNPTAATSNSRMGRSAGTWIEMLQDPQYPDRVDTVYPLYRVVDLTEREDDELVLKVNGRAYKKDTVLNMTKAMLKESFGALRYVDGDKVTVDIAPRVAHNQQIPAHSNLRGIYITADAHDILPKHLSFAEKELIEARKVVPRV